MMKIWLPFIGLFLVVLGSEIPVSAASLPEHMHELRAALNQITRLLKDEASTKPAGTLLSKKTIEQVSVDMDRLIDLSRALESPPLARGNLFAKRARTFRAEITSLKDSLSKVKAGEGEMFAENVSVACGNCHSCGLEHQSH